MASSSKDMEDDASLDIQLEYLGACPSHFFLAKAKLQERGNGLSGLAS